MIVSVGRMMRKGGGGLVWPKGLKESIKAIYDPTKQGMTNYDVIEAYVEDFTHWTLDNTGITSTPKKIVIPAGTELKYVIAFRGFNSFTAGFDIKYTGNAVITYRYNKEDGTVGTIAIDKSGIYHLPASVRTQKNFGFYCNPQTVTEEATIEQLPTSILKDFSGNKHDAYLYGFKGKLNSGVGIYAQDFKNWNYGSTINSNISTKSYNKFHIVKKKADNWFGFTIGIPKNNYYNQSYKLKFTINKKIDDIKFNVVSTDGNLKTTNVYSVKINDGSIIDIPVISEEIFNNKEETNIYYDFGTNKDIEIDVELIADYPNQLCYDGKSYAVAYGLPILTDYTVMAERTWFERQNRACFLSKITTRGTGAFGFEFYNEFNACVTYSYNLFTDVELFKNGITYQTKNSYNGTPIKYNARGIKDNSELYIGKLRPTEHNGYVGCHGKIIVADRSFTKDEITWLKDNLFRK